MAAGPLDPIKVIEIGSIGPGPFAAMMLADMGADVVRLERPARGATLGSGAWNLTNRGRPSVAVDLKHPSGRALVLRLARDADALIEGFRPGVMERLGLGPTELLAANERLVYGRMTGYGQDGPLSSAAGHDINYIAIAGVLGAIAREGDQPMFPLNLLGDYGGGGLLLAYGIVCALLEARSSGHGQVIDASMVEGASLLSTLIHAMRHQGNWDDERPGTNVLDSGAHFYEVYATADGGHMAVGAIEPQFYAELLRVLNLDPGDYPQNDPSRWTEFKNRFAAIFRTKTRAEWTTLFESAEACTTPVIRLGEAPCHPHNTARGSFIEIDGVVQPIPAPRLSRTPGSVRMGPRDVGADTDSALAAWGVPRTEITVLRELGAIS
jgi:alpha-methylacyl-CoA racemase